MNTIQFLGAIELGLLYGIVAMAVYLTFRVINFPDLTVDGSFPLGAAVAATLIVKGVNPYVATLLAFMAGCLAGSITAYLHVRWKILGLLAGILTMTALYSINLRIMGKPNIALINEITVFSDHVQNGTHNSLLILSMIVLLLILVLFHFLRSRFGLALRASGINPRVSPAYGIKVSTMIFVGLCLSNGLIASAGALFAQAHGFADISMGNWTLIIGLASVIVGETLFHTNKLWLILLSCVLGSILYRLAIAFALNAQFLGLEGSDLNLITAILVVIALLSPRLKQQIVKSKGR